jgi:hypothetical protein
MQPDAKAKEQIQRITNRLIQMNPAQCAIQIDIINQILDGSATVTNYQLPKEAQKTQGIPKGATNKPRTTKRDPSEFEHVEKKRKTEDQKDEKKKQLKKTKEDKRRQKNKNEIKNKEPAQKKEQPAKKKQPPHKNPNYTTIDRKNQPS